MTGRTPLSSLIPPGGVNATCLKCGESRPLSAFGYLANNVRDPICQYCRTDPPHGTRHTMARLAYTAAPVTPLEKQCSCCKRVLKPVTFHFAPAYGNKDGLSGVCRSCVSARNKAYRMAKGTGTQKEKAG